MSRRAFRGIWLGRRPYKVVYDLQNTLREARLSHSVPDTVLLLEHDPVVTLGRGAHAENLLVSEEILARRGVEVVRTDRGGDVTVHAPGQLVGYPIIDLSPDRCDVRRYVGDLAETMRRVVSAFGISAGTLPGLIGLWVDPSHPEHWSFDIAESRREKLGAIGVRIAKWVTMHGFALNLTPDLSLFELIVPCGIRQHGVTSVQVLTGKRIDVKEASVAAFQALAEVFDARTLSFEDWSQRVAFEDALSGV